jgi:hypothetical protein
MSESEVNNWVDKLRTALFYVPDDKSMAVAAGMNSRIAAARLQHGSVSEMSYSSSMLVGCRWLLILRARNKTGLDCLCQGDTARTQGPTLFLLPSSPTFCFDLAPT